jgi:hypothetical protein
LNILYLQNKKKKKKKESDDSSSSSEDDGDEWIEKSGKFQTYFKCEFFINKLSMQLNQASLVKKDHEEVMTKVATLDQTCKRLPSHTRKWAEPFCLVRVLLWRPMLRMENVSPGEVKSA